MLDMFVDELRNLERFELWSGHNSWRAPYPEHESGDPAGSVTRDQQERKSLMHFAAFLVLRHPKLKRVIHDVRTGRTFNGPENVINNFVLDTGETVRKWAKASRKLRASDAEPQEIEVSSNCCQFNHDQGLTDSAGQSVGCSQDSASERNTTRQYSHR